MSQAHRDDERRYQTVSPGHSQGADQHDPERQDPFHHLNPAGPHGPTDRMSFAQAPLHHITSQREREAADPFWGGHGPPAVVLGRNGQPIKSGFDERLPPQSVDHAVRASQRDPGKATHGPDGMPLAGSDFVINEDGQVTSKQEGSKYGALMQTDNLKGAWSEAFSCRNEQFSLALIHFDEIRGQLKSMQQAMESPDGKFVNDPAVMPKIHNEMFPVGGLDGGLIAFEPHRADILKYVPDPDEAEADDPFEALESLGEAAAGIGNHEESGTKVTDRWVRLMDFAGAASTGAVVFDDSNPKITHCGRIFPGDPQCENGYFVEAMNAITLRPHLVRQLFYCWDVESAIYILQLYKNGTWVRVELDDYVPGMRTRGVDDKNYPYCCRSEHFPHVLWPSLVEKAYAKIHTLRKRNEGEPSSGGWRCIGGGGRVEEAMADLTGGVGGRFSTRDVSPDRLFIYLYYLQRYTIFACRVDSKSCTRHGVWLNNAVPHSINRAAAFEGHCYVQVFCAGNMRETGGIESLTVPEGLISLYPEIAADGFFWISIYDFHAYYDVIFECRCTNSPEIGIPRMPLPGPTHPLAHLPSAQFPFGLPVAPTTLQEMPDLNRLAESGINPVPIVVPRQEAHSCGDPRPPSLRPKGTQYMSPKTHLKVPGAGSQVGSVINNPFLPKAGTQKVKPPSQQASGTTIQMPQGGFGPDGLAGTAVAGAGHNPQYPPTMGPGGFVIPQHHARQYADTLKGHSMAQGLSPGHRGQALQAQLDGHGQEQDEPVVIEYPIFYEKVLFTENKVNHKNVPEFLITVPGNHCPCEITACLSQVDNRITQLGPTRNKHLYVPILLKVFENIQEDEYDKEMVCRSNWLPIRDAMVSFKVSKGGTFLVAAEFEDRNQEVDRLIFRCYSSQSNVTVVGNPVTKRHQFVESPHAPSAIKYTFVGCINPEIVTDMNSPEPYDIGTEFLRRKVPEIACSLM